MESVGTKGMNSPIFSLESLLSFELDAAVGPSNRKKNANVSRPIKAAWIAASGQRNYVPPPAGDSQIWEDLQELTLIPSNISFRDLRPVGIKH